MTVVGSLRFAEIRTGIFPTANPPAAQGPLIVGTECSQSKLLLVTLRIAREQRETQRRGGRVSGLSGGQGSLIRHPGNGWN
jgi:hypothetical protein